MGWFMGFKIFEPADRACRGVGGGGCGGKMRAYYRKLNSGEKNGLSRCRMKSCRTTRVVLQLHGRQLHR